jgi:hypothetical protein
VGTATANRFGGGKGGKLTERALGASVVTATANQFGVAPHPCGQLLDVPGTISRTLIGIGRLQLGQVTFASMSRMFEPLGQPAALLEDRSVRLDDAWHPRAWI